MSVQPPENSAHLPNDMDAEAQFQWLCAHSELVSLRLVGVQSALQPVEASGQLSYDIDVEVEGSHLAGDGMAFQANYSLDVVDEDSTQVFTATLTYVVGYSTDIDQLPEELLAAFGHRSVLLTLAPYVRNEVQHLTTEAGLPPLLLGLFKVPQPPPDRSSSDLA